MKSKKKIFSIILALVMAVGMIGVPTFRTGIRSVKAGENELFSNSALLVNYEKFDEKYNVTDNNTISFDDYLSNYPADSNSPVYDVYASLWAPDGTQLLNFQNVKADTIHKFTEPGLYAVVFAKDFGSADKPAIFSRQYYIAVENSIEEIVLTETVSETAKTGSYVEIPECETTNVTIKVFSPYGENVPYNSGKFTNINNVLGTYYIEYSKTIDVNGDDVVQYKYVTVKFGDSYKEPITSEIKKEETKEDEKDYMLSDNLKELESKNVIYLYKSYDMAGVQVKNSQGDFVDLSSIADATITITYTKNVGGADIVYYYDFCNEEASEDECHNLFSDIYGMSVFTATDMEGITSSDKSGLEYTITFKSEELDFEKEIKAKSMIDNTVYNFECDGVFQDVILVDKNDDVSEENDINVFTLPECKVTIKDGYSQADYESFLDDTGVQVKVNFTDANGNKIEFAEPGEGVEYTIEKAGNEYKIDFSKLADKARDGNFSYKLEVSYSIDYEIKEGITGTLTKSYNSHLATQVNDDRKPTGITIEKHENILYSQNGSNAEFTFPSASASDVDNSDNKTNGVNVSIEYKRTDIDDVAHNANIGDTVSLALGSYIVTYKFTDTAGNERVQSFYLKVCNEERFDIDIDSINIIGASFSKEDSKYTFTFDSVSVATALVYTDNAEILSPRKMNIENGQIKSLEVETDKNFVVVLSGRNQNNDVYASVAINGIHNIENIKAFSYNLSNKESIFVANEYDSLSVKVGDRVLFLQESDLGFAVETESGKYLIENNNEIVILYPGKYTITNNDNGIKTEVTATESTVANISDFLVMKQVVSSKGTEAERTIEVRAPYIENYFGHSMVANVTTSGGVPIEIKDQKFVISKTDKYLVTFTFNCLSGTKDMVTTVSSGEVIKPVISITNNYENIYWTGDSHVVYLIDATAKDKFGNELTNIVVSVYDKFGKSLEIKKDASNKSYIEITDAGIYSVYYTVTDADGFSATTQVSFMMLYNELEENDGLSGWAITGIVVGSIVGSGLIAWLIYMVISNEKNKSRFINKARQAKKAKKVSDEKENSSNLYTIVQSKNEAEWTVKKNNRVIAKTSSKEEAIAKINEDCEGQKKIKVYNKHGRLIDSID